MVLLYALTVIFKQTWFVEELFVKVQILQYEVIVWSQVIEDDIKLKISKYLIIWRVVYP